MMTEFFLFFGRGTDDSDVVEDVTDFDFLVGGSPSNDVVDEVAERDPSVRGDVGGTLVKGIWVSIRICEYEDVDADCIEGDVTLAESEGVENG